MTAPTDAEISLLCERLRALTVSATGFRPDAVAEGPLSRLVRKWLSVETSSSLRWRIRERDPALLDRLFETVVPHPTYFYRHHHQFQYLHMALRVGQIAAGQNQLRAWSAGCATGEEAYCIAATTLSASKGRDPIEGHVLGTDLLPHNIDIARKGYYSGRSIRASTPLLHPVVESVSEGAFQVTPEVQRMTAFAHGNLLEPMPSDTPPFDLVFCRNVFIYLSPAAMRSVWRHITSMMKIGGTIFFAPSDPVDAIDQVERLTSEEVAAFTYTGPTVVAMRSTPARGLLPLSPPRPSKPKSAPPEPPPSPPEPPSIAPEEDELPAETTDEILVRNESIAHHLEALAHLEHDRVAKARAILERVCKLDPEYVPGLVEYSLVHERLGERKSARRLMSTALDLLDGLAEDAVIRGPTDLPASYYRSVVATFLGKGGTPAMT